MTQEWGVAWDLMEMGSAQEKGVSEGQAPQTRREISSQLPSRKEATWRRKKKEGWVRHDEEELACTERINHMALNPFCIHPLMSRHRTSLCHVWHNYSRQYFLCRFSCEHIIYLLIRNLASQIRYVGRQVIPQLSSTITKLSFGKFCLRKDSQTV